MRDEAAALRDAARDCESDAAHGSQRMAGYAEAFRLMADELEAKAAELETADLQGETTDPVPHHA